MPLTVVIVDLETPLPTLTSQLLMPRHGVLALGTALARAGHQVAVHVECLNGVCHPDLIRADVVGFAVTYPNLTRVAALARAVKQDNPRAVILAGGPHATVSPTEVLGFADIVVRDEGEKTAVELLERLENGGRIDDVQGITFRQDGRVVHTPRRAYIRGDTTTEDLTLLKGFSLPTRVSRMTRGEVMCGYATTSRGCPFPCTFCYENMIGGTGHRVRDVDSLVEDIRQKKQFFGTNRFWFADSNFTTNPAHAREVLRAIIDANLGCRFSVLCRVDVGTRPDILDLMRDAGVATLSLGMEAIEDERLASIEKRQTVAAIVHTIEEVHRRGMAAFGLFMVGFDGDTEQTPWRITRFCREHEVEDLSIYCLSEYPELPGRTLPRYRICEPNSDYYSGHFVTTFPRDVRPSVLERAVFGALLDFYDPRGPQNDRRLAGKLDIRAGQYLQIKRMAQIAARHQVRLAEVETPYYGPDGTLREEILRANPLIRHPIPADTLAGWSDPADPKPATDDRMSLPVVGAVPEHCEVGGFL